MLHPARPTHTHLWGECCAAVAAAAAAYTQASRVGSSNQARWGDINIHTKLLAQLLHISVTTAVTTGQLAAGNCLTLGTGQPR